VTFIYAELGYYIHYLDLVKKISANSAMPLFALPNELLHDISIQLKSERDINAFAQASRRLYNLLNGHLYRYNVEQSKSSALLWAARHGQVETAQKSLREEANIQATNDDEAALFLAAENGHKEVVKLLIEEGADVSAQSRCYGNALQAASAGGHEAVVRLLLDKGADVNAQGRYYSNALQAASAGSHEAVVRLLLDRGAITLE
jgi:ankyrin repeat protein